MRRESDWERLLAEQITRNGPGLFSLAYGYVGNSRTAEEVCQEAFSKAWEQRDRLRNAESLFNWLRAVVKNESLLTCRRARKEREATAPGNLAARKADDPPHHHFDLRDSVAVALEKLPDEIREVVVLCLMQEMAGKEAARMLGISEATVCRRLVEGVERLRPYLADWQGTTGERT